MYCNYLYNIFLFDIKAVPEKHLSNKEKCTETLSLQQFENEKSYSLTGSTHAMLNRSKYKFQYI
jgi:hypothetical protein